jgi:hypothetical protein
LLSRDGLLLLLLLERCHGQCCLDRLCVRELNLEVLVLHVRLVPDVIGQVWVLECL